MYSEDDMIQFALNFGMAVMDHYNNDTGLPNASVELENWKEKTGRNNNA